VSLKTPSRSGFASVPCWPRAVIQDCNFTETEVGAWCILGTSHERSSEKVAGGYLTVSSRSRIIKVAEFRLSQLAAWVTSYVLDAPKRKEVGKDRRAAVPAEDREGDRKIVHLQGSDRIFRWPGNVPEGLHRTCH
jgi:hypothetical protein